MERVNCILLVDDNPADNYFHTYIIKESDICDHLEIVTDGEEALYYLENTGDPDEAKNPKPNLIFLDINMPRMNGFEFLEEYRKLDEKLKSDTVVIMLTTSVNPDEKRKALEIKEVKEFINKPLEIETLHDILNKYF